MNDGMLLRTEVLAINRGDHYSADLLKKLLAFTNQYFIIDNIPRFYETILRIHSPHDLCLYYNHRGELVGYTVLLHEEFDEKTVFIGSTFNAPHVPINFAVARFVITQLMKYRVAHPYSEISYFANINTPSRYEFFSHFGQAVCPKPELSVLESILPLVERLKVLHDWPSHPAHPMLIGNQPGLREVWQFDSHRNTDLAYFTKVNPDYCQGFSLLVYMPAHLEAISEGIKQVVNHPAGILAW